MKHLAALFVTFPAAAIAAAPAPQVQLDSRIFSEVESVVAGKTRTILKTPSTVLPGDRLVFQTSFRNGGTALATKVALTSPLPRGVRYSGDSSPGAQVSVDGGRTFGDLASLKVAAAGVGTRAAMQSDVTTIRWIVPSVAPGESGILKYRGIVR